MDPFCAAYLSFSVGNCTDSISLFLCYFHFMMGAESAYTDQINQKLVWENISVALGFPTSTYFCLLYHVFLLFPIPLEEGRGGVGGVLWGILFVCFIFFLTQ